MTIGAAQQFFLGASKATGGGAAGYQIERSLRFNSSDSAYLSRTPAVAGNRRTWTWAGWVKRSSLVDSMIFSAGTSDTNRSIIGFLGGNDGKLYVLNNVSSSGYLSHVSAAVFRDVSAWYHFVIAADTAQVAAADRFKFYVNGVLQTWETTANPQNTDTLFNTTSGHTVGSNPPYAASAWFSGYLADIHFIDGQALTPSSFTEVSATTGQLIPLAYSGSFGTNGFWLKFSDNSAATAATLGKDYSGNSNNWTPNNLSVTAGAGNDSLVDTPTSYGTDTGVGGEVRGNYCTWNPLDIAGAGSAVFTVTNGNLDIDNTGGWDGRIICTMATVSGQYYYEITLNSLGAQAIFFFGFCATNFTRPIYDAVNPGVFYAGYGDIYKDGVLITTGAAMTAGDVIGIAFNATNGTASFYKNGTLQGAVTGIVASNYCPAVISSAGPRPFNISANFGQRAFAYTAPSGFKALCDTNLPAPLTAKGNTLMDVVLYNGNSSTQAISGLGFSPDLVWLKARSRAAVHTLYDTIRGATKHLVSNATNAESTLINGLTSFDSSGFTLGSDSEANFSGHTFVAWTWDAGTSTVSNTSGSITSQVRANASAGFSVVTFTAPASGTYTWGHGLGVTPSLVIVKDRDNGSTQWSVYHPGAITATNQYILLNTTGAVTTLSGVWGSALPNSTVVSLTSGTVVNANAKAVAYCFAPVVGYSSFGSYTGNGLADGPFVYTGFRPRWIMVKNTVGGNWQILDSARNQYNVVDRYLQPNASSAESMSDVLDIVSNGFKIRDSLSNWNGSTNPIIYAAFAESPFQFSRAR